jgi:hypothetical protein
MLTMSTAVESIKGSPSVDPVRLHRRARTLIGWLRAEEAKAALTGPQAAAMSIEHDRLAADARGAVSARPAGIDQRDVIGPVSQELASHIEDLRLNAASSAFFNEGWTVAMADLTRTCAIQPSVMIDDANARTNVVDASDPTSIAAVTLPIGTPLVLGATYNPAKQAWVFSSANPNLRVVGQAQGEIPGGHLFGFGVAISASFMQVANYNGRHLLRDGYHRAYGLLARGITHAPVFVREFERFDDLRLPPGLLPQDTYLGPRPPVLLDYLNDDVSAVTSVLVTQKVVIIQALEVATIG